MQTFILYTLGVSMVLLSQVKTFVQRDETDDSECAQQDLDEEKSSEIREDLNYCDNNLAQCGILKKIQYFPCSRNTNSCSTRVNLNSACVRCEICLSIADQVNQTLVYFHKKVFLTNYLNDTQIGTLFKLICEYSFENYGMRINHGNRVIFDRMPESHLIETNVDGQWDEHLSRRCHELVESAGPSKLFKLWKTWCESTNLHDRTEELGTLLCRDEASFYRDCRNIAFHDRQVLESSINENLKNKIAEIFLCV
ncbi:hypothetical protein QAD02_010979 [Eretmocerus hayati]|uniref:Uncharacterized protein n=1 Tax=Eretmocerus hayati TaxID=131215 RepID=A0ACC2NWG1_9HYME|nr:hypothetical protein QAD02_010979 [Eretmocerus hayati]